MTCHHNFKMSNITGAFSGAGTAYPSGKSLLWGLCCSIFSVQCFVNNTLVCYLSLFFWQMYFVLTAFDYPFGTFQLFLDWSPLLTCINLHAQGSTGNLTCMFIFNFCPLDVSTNNSGVTSYVR